MTFISRSWFRLLAAAAIMSSGFRAIALENEPDFNFGPDGPWGNPTGFVQGWSLDSNIYDYLLITDASGRLLASGSPGILRWQPDGTFDRKIGGEDSQLPVDARSQAAGAMAVTDDGKIVALCPDGVLRFLDNGTPDASFAGDGWAAFGGELPATLGGAWAVVPQSGGKILGLGGSLYRLNANGTLDTGFGTGGMAKFTNFDPRFIAMQSDGGILVAGSAGGQFSVWRFTANGQLDESFGAGGELVTRFPQVNVMSGSTGIRILSDGKIYVPGLLYLSGSGESVFAAARWLPDGTPDATFGEDGLVIGDILPLTPAGAFLHTNGRIDIPGTVTDGRGFTRLAVYRVNDRGTPVAGNGPALSMLADLNHKSRGYDCVPGKDGATWAVGSVETWDSRRELVLARFLGPDAPPGDLRVEHPPGHDILNGATVDLGSVPMRRPVNLSFVLRNAGAGQLTGVELLPLSTGNFKLTGVTLPSSVLMEGANTFVVPLFETLAPGPFSAVVQLLSTDPAEPVYRITFTGVVPEPPPSQVEVEFWEAGQSAPVSGTLDLGKTVNGTTRTFRLRNNGIFDLERIEVRLNSTTPYFRLMDVSNSVWDVIYVEKLAAGAVSEPFRVWVNFSDDPTFPATAILHVTADPAEQHTTDITVRAHPLNKLDYWRLRNFSTIVPEGSAADNADPDGDGFPNLVEYAFDTSPVEGGPLPDLEFRATGNVLEYRMIRTASSGADFDYAMEWAESLTGSWSQAGMTVTVSPLAGGRERVTLAVPAGTGTRFARLRVTHKS